MQIKTYGSKSEAPVAAPGDRRLLRKLSEDQNVVSTTHQTLPATCRILIVDRDAFSSALLAQAVEREGNYEAFGLSPSELVHTLASKPIDLVVIAAELSYKSRSGFELAQSILRTNPEIRVILLLNQVSKELVFSAFRAGARGVFSRQEPIPEFLDCIQHVKRGYIWAGVREADFLLEAFRSIPAPSATPRGAGADLTVRELQVVQSAAQGRTNKNIALELGLSEHTVKNYLFRAFDKLGVSSRIELLFYLTMKGHSFTQDAEEVNENVVA